MDADLIERLADRAAASQDCAHFAADLLMAETGEDLLREWRGRDQREALGRFRGMHRAILWGMRHRAAWRRVEPQKAVAPALGLALVEGRSWACCVALERGWWAARFDDGLTLIRSEDVRRAWMPLEAGAR